jgi:hypothetical protein
VGGTGFAVDAIVLLEEGLLLEEELLDLIDAAMFLHGIVWGHLPRLPQLVPTREPRPTTRPFAKVAVARVNGRRPHPVAVAQVNGRWPNPWRGSLHLAHKRTDAHPSTVPLLKRARSCCDAAVTAGQAISQFPSNCLLFFMPMAGRGWVLPPMPSPDKGVPDASISKQGFLTGWQVARRHRA